MKPLALLAALLLLTGCAQAGPSAVEQATNESVSTSESPTTPQESSSPEVAEENQASSEVETTETEEASSEPSPSAEPSRTNDAMAAEDVAAEDAEPIETEESNQPSEEPAPAQSANGYTIKDVAQNSTADSCWVAIDGGVYDLTRWIRSHPGGSGAILQLCGTDGTQQFLGQHGGQSRPASTLDGYYLGPLR